MDAAFSFVLSWNLIGQRENRSHYVTETVSCVGFADVIFRRRQATAENTSAFIGKVPSFKQPNKLTTSEYSIEFTCSDNRCEMSKTTVNSGFHSGGLVRMDLVFQDLLTRVL